VHPILASRTGIASYLGFWLLVALLLATAYASASPASGSEAVVVVVPLILFYGLVCLSAWYVCRAAPMNVASVARIVVTQMFASAVTTSLWLLAWEGWTQVLASSYSEAVDNYRAQLPLVIASGVLLFWSAAMFHYLLIAFEKSRTAITHGLGLEVMAREAELKALRAQIDPHFLFNSLNSISALTTTDPKGAREMCILLAAFFRNCVRLGNEDRVSLEEELEMVQNYLDIEKVRCGSRLTTSIDVDDACDSCFVPPLILQPLIENAVRYGIHSRTDGGSVKLSASCDSEVLVLRIENPYDDDSRAGPGTGVGLVNVKSRIRALFGNRAGLTTSSKDGLFRVELELPCLAESAEIES
jgi:signal transduction histidine kinase